MPPHRAPVPPNLIALATRQAGLLSARQCAAAGLSREQYRGLQRRGEAIPVARGVVLAPGMASPPATRSDALDQARRRAALTGLLAYGPRAIATGLCALVLAGVLGAPITIRPEVAFRRGDPRRPIPGIRVRQVPIPEWIVMNSFPLATPDLALAQAVPEMDRMTAVSLMDSALHRGLITATGLARAHDLALGHRGVAHTHAWWAEADHRSESPAETVARLSCSDSGFPPDVLQLVILDSAGRFVARVDLAWVLPDGRWLLVEVDGVDVHGSPAALVADLHRQNRLLGQQTILRRYTGRDAATGRTAAEVGHILSIGGWRPGRPAPPGQIRLSEAA
jgi:hypothetical protein